MVKEVRRLVTLKPHLPRLLPHTSPQVPHVYLLTTSHATHCASLSMLKGHHFPLLCGHFLPFSGLFHDLTGPTHVDCISLPGFLTFQVDSAKGRHLQEFGK